MIRRLLLGSSLLLALLAQSALWGGAGDSPLKAVLDSERAFAALSVRAGMDSAFVAFLDEDAVILRPGPVNGPQWIREHPAPPITLSWEPDFACVAASGDLGYTSGPWKVEDNPPQNRPPRHGSFVSVWQKRPGRPWKVVYDCGISHALRVPGDLEKVIRRAGEFKVSKPGDRAGRAESEIRRADSLLAVNAAAMGYAPALLGALSASGRVYRNGRLPATTPDSCAALIRLRAGSVTWSSTKTTAARSGDLGWCYGPFAAMAPDGSKEQGYYLRVWQKGRSDGTWKVVLDCENIVVGE